MPDLTPRDIQKLRRDLGLERVYMKPVRSFIRMRKTSTQSIGTGNTATISFQGLTYNIGGGADLGENALVVPEGMEGLWRVQAKLHLDSASVTDGANYRIGLMKNGTETEFENNHAASPNRALTARLNHVSSGVEGDIIKIEMTNVAGGLVTILAESYLSFEFMGTI